jgi:8-oxo-dGTP diphosphatase
LAKALDAVVKSTDKISQDGYENGTANVRAVVGKIVRKRKTTVVCTHGPVAPVVLKELALATGTPRTPELDEAGLLDTAGFVIVHMSATHPSSGIVAVESHLSLI